MKLLAIETATEACSVALWVNGDVHERFEIAPRRHAELVLPWAEALLVDAGIAKSQLDAIAVGRGPGAFTGVRLAIAIAQGVALALDRPVVPVSTLAALALGSSSSAGQEPGEGASADHILAAIDARMGEVYWATFTCNGDDVIALSKEVVARPESVVLPEHAGGWRGIGSGFAASDGALQRHLQERLTAVDATALPHAADVARLAIAAFARGEVFAPEHVEPAYLRNNVALTVVEQQALRDAR